MPEYAPDRPESFDRWPKTARAYAEALEYKLRDAEEWIFKLQSIISPEGRAPSRVNLKSGLDQSVPLRGGSWDDDGSRTTVRFDLRTEEARERDDHGGWIDVRLSSYKGEWLLSVMGNRSVAIHPEVSNSVKISLPPRQ